MKNLILFITFFSLFFSAQKTFSKSPTDLKKYIFKIDGKINYKNHEGFTRGLYGAKVILHMLKKSDGMIAQPTGISLNPKDLQVSRKSDGSFSLDLQFLANMANNLSTIKEGYIGYEFHPECEYQPKFNDAGKYFIVLTVKDTLGKSMVIYKDFTVQGMEISQNGNMQNGNTQPATNNFSIYPNPAAGSFTLNYTVEQEGYIAISLISTTNNSESILYQQQSKKGDFRQVFNTSLFPIGTYIIKFTQRDKNGRVMIKTDKITLLK